MLAMVFHSSFGSQKTKPLLVFRNLISPFSAMFRRMPLAVPQPTFKWKATRSMLTGSEWVPSILRACLSTSGSSNFTTTLHTSALEIWALKSLGANCLSHHIYIPTSLIMYVVIDSESSHPVRGLMELCLFIRHRRSFLCRAPHHRSLHSSNMDFSP